MSRGCMWVNTDFSSAWVKVPSSYGRRYSAAVTVAPGLYILLKTLAWVKRNTGRPA